MPGGTVRLKRYPRATAEDRSVSEEQGLGKIAEKKGEDRGYCWRSIPMSWAEDVLVKGWRRRDLQQLQ